MPPFVDDDDAAAQAAQLDPPADGALAGTAAVGVGGVDGVAAVLEVVVEEGAGEGHVACGQGHGPHDHAGDGEVDPGDPAAGHGGVGPALESLPRERGGEGLVELAVEDEAELPAPGVESAHVADGVGPGHARRRRLPRFFPVAGNHVGLDGVERGVGPHPDIPGPASVGAPHGNQAGLAPAPGEPGVGDDDATLAAPDAQGRVHLHLGAAARVGDDVSVEVQHRGRPFVDAAGGADVPGALDRHRVGEIGAQGGPRQQAAHGYGVTAHVHDAPAGSRIGEADVLVAGAHVVAEVGLDQAQLADGAVADEADQAGGLRMAAVHEGFHEKDPVAARGLHRNHGLGGVGGQGFFAQDGLARGGAADGPLQVHVVGKGNVYGFHAAVGEQFRIAAIAPGHVEPGAEVFGFFPAAAGDGQQAAGARLSQRSGKDGGDAPGAENAPLHFGVHVVESFAAAENGALAGPDPGP